MKIKLSSAFLFVLFSAPALAQHPVDALAMAELNFARACAEKGIRASFLIHADTSAVNFKNGKVISAYRQLLDGKDSPGLISWAPSYTEMANSNDWGYTTGNYEIRPDKISDSIVSTGRYTTLWHKTASGEWKYLIDLGINYKHVPLENSPVRIDAEKVNGLSFVTDTLMKLENDYLAQLKFNPANIYNKFYSEKFILNLNGHPLVKSSEQASELMKDNNVYLRFAPKGIMISPSKDLLGVYGIVTFKNTDHGYLRIWRHEKAGWKIALEVLPI